MNLIQPMGTSPEKYTVWLCYLCPWHGCSQFWKNCVHNSRDGCGKIGKGSEESNDNMKGLENISYNVRLEELNLFWLSERHLKGYLIIAYK